MLAFARSSRENPTSHLLSAFLARSNWAYLQDPLVSIHCLRSRLFLVSYLDHWIVIRSLCPLLLSYLPPLSSVLLLKGNSSTKEIKVHLHFFKRACEFERILVLWGLRGWKGLPFSLSPLCLPANEFCRLKNRIPLRPSLTAQPSFLFVLLELIHSSLILGVLQHGTEKLSPVQFLLFIEV